MVAFGLLLSQYVSTSAQLFDCNKNFFLTISENNAEAPTIHNVSIDTGLNIASFSVLNDQYDLPFNSVGYNVKDQLLYGLNPQNYHLYQINALGEITDLGIPENLDTINYEYYAGDFSPNGNRLVLIGRDKETGIDKEYFSLRFEQGNITAGFLALLSDNGTRLEDIAYDPIHGTLYGYDALHKRIVTIALSSGAVSTYSSEPLMEIQSMGSLFFDEQGVLFGYGGSASEINILYKFDKFERIILDKYVGPWGRASDGCSCPYRIQFYKNVSTPKVLPCSEFTMTYSMTNTAGVSYTQMELLDSFPPEFTITEIIVPPVFGEIESGVGTNKFHVTGMDVLLGQDSIVIKVAVGADAEGAYETHALLNNFPMALGASFESDNFYTTLKDDPTGVEVVVEEFLVDTEQTFICEDGVIEIATEVIADEYLWSDGSTEPIIEVRTAGTYWLQVTNDCIDYRDTILVESVNEPLTVDLGEDVDLILGEQLPLTFLTNAQTDIQITWTVEDEMSMTCLDCENPLLFPRETMIVEVWIEDAYGCTASDQIEIRVDRKVEVYASNIFTPNFDGLNDLFYLQGKVDFEIERFSIYNRWGSVVHEARQGIVNDSDHAWNGLISGKEASVGVYLWMAQIRLADGSIYSLNGDITLVK